jgi:hypothetical protein
VGQALEEAMLKYWCKVKKSMFYSQVKELLKEFYKLLEEMLHEWDTNIVEGMNQFLPNSFQKIVPML